MNYCYRLYLEMVLKQLSLSELLAANSFRIWKVSSESLEGKEESLLLETLSTSNL